MTRLYLQAGRLRLRMALLVLAGFLAFCCVNMLVCWGTLDLSAVQLRRQAALHGALGGAVLLLLAWYVDSRLRPVVAMLQALRETGVATPAQEESAQRAALLFPIRLAAACSAAGVSAVGAGMMVATAYHGMDQRLALSIALANVAEILLVSVFLYLLARSQLRPIVVHFRHEEVPPEMRVSIRSKIMLALLSLCLAASVPTALVSNVQLERIRAESLEADRLHLAEMIAYGSTRTTPDALGRSVASVHLSEGARVRMRESGSPTSSPLAPGHRRPYVEVAGGRSAPPAGQTLLVLVVLLVGLATIGGRTIGHNLGADVALVGRRIRAMAEAEAGEEHQLPPLVPEAVQFSDLRRLAAAFNDLLQRSIEIDITHFLAIEKTLEADRVKNQFLANVSHDLRSPLNAVMGFSELLLRLNDRGLDAVQREEVETIHRSGTELLRLINQVLDSAKLEAGRVRLAREETLPAEILSRALRSIQERGGTDRIAIEGELQPGISAVMVDPQRLTQIVELLVEFCVESIEEGRVMIQLQVERVPSAGRAEAQKVLRVRVGTSTGGLPEHEVQRLFRGFRRRPGRRGLGLALPLARSFVELHGGTLSVGGGRGAGFLFTADIPVLEQQALARLRSRPDSNRPGSPGAAGAKPTGEKPTGEKPTGEKPGAPTGTCGGQQSEDGAGGSQ